MIGGATETITAATGTATAAAAATVMATGTAATAGGRPQRRPAQLAQRLESRLAQ
jgi:hypothetical protein